MFSQSMIENRIKQLREQNGLSASALAKIVGTSQPQITRLENGERPLDFVWLEKIAGALSVSPKDLIADFVPCYCALLAARLILSKEPQKAE